MNDDLFNELLQFHTTNPYIDVVLVVLYVCVGYYLKQNFKFWSWPMELKVLLVGTLVSAVYIGVALSTGLAKPSDWLKWLCSYALSTSFYEIILKRIPSKRDGDDQPAGDLDGPGRPDGKWL